jgi:outer membrane biosynthesis protein TonB
MRTGLAISAVGHLALLAWGLVTFVPKAFDSNSAEALPIDIITAEQFSKVTVGQRDAKKTAQPKPLVEKIAEPKLAENPAPKIAEKKKEIQPSAEPKPAPESKPDKAEKKTPELKVDQIAEALKKDEAKKPLMEKAETPVPPRKPVPPQPKFDASQVAALLDKRTPQRQAAAGSTLNALATLGLANAESATLSQSELDALRARLAKLWNPPIGIRKPEDFIVRIQVRLGRDGKLSAPPLVVTSGKGTEFESARDSAVRALYQGQPFDMLRQETYDVWQDMEITFDPREMFRG